MRPFRYQSLWSLWKPFAREHKFQVLGAIILGFTANYATLLLTLSIGNFFELVLGMGGGKSRALNLLGPGTRQTVTGFFIFFFAAVLLRFTLSWMNQYVSGILGAAFASSLRDRLLHVRLVRGQPGRALSDDKVLMPFSTDMSQVQRLVTNGILGFVKDLLFIAMSIYVLFRLQVQLTFLVLFFLLTAYFLLRWYNRANEHTIRRKRKRNGALWKTVRKMLSQPGLPSDADMEAFRNMSRKQGEAQQKHLWKKALLNALAPATLYLLLGMVMLSVALGKQLIQPATPDLVTFMLLLITLFPTLRNILKVEQVWVQASISGARFSEPEKLAYLYSLDTERCQSG